MVLKIYQIEFVVWVIMPPPSSLLVVIELNEVNLIKRVSIKKCDSIKTTLGIICVGYVKVNDLGIRMKKSISFKIVDSVLSHIDAIYTYVMAYLSQLSSHKSTIHCNRQI